jgi:hypothetical protein
VDTGPATDHYREVKKSMAAGTPLVMMRLVHSDAGNVATIESVTRHTAMRSFATPKADGEEKLLNSQVDSRRSSLSSVGGDLRMNPEGVTLRTNDLYSDVVQSDAYETRTPQPDFAWQANPEYSGGPAGMQSLNSITVS